jgi:hypothetical protein
VDFGFRLHGELNEGRPSVLEPNDLPESERSARHAVVELLAWLETEQRQAMRWGYNDQGIYRFQLTGPELLRIKNLLTRVDAEAQRYFDEWCHLENKQAARDLEMYRSGYSCGYSDAKDGTPMRDEAAGRLFLNLPEQS